MRTTATLPEGAAAEPAGTEPADTGTAGTGTAGVRPTADQLAAWRLLLRSHATLVRRLEGELLAEHDLPLPSYDVLVQLSEAPRRSLRMTELADRVLLSRSGLTRLVDRLVRDGLVDRAPCPQDARGTLAVLTPAGLARLETAWVTHARGVAGHLDRLDAAETAALTSLLAKLVPEAAEQSPPPGGGCGAPGPSD